MSKVMCARELIMWKTMGGIQDNKTTPNTVDMGHDILFKTHKMYVNCKPLHKLQTLDNFASIARFMLTSALLWCGVLRVQDMMISVSLIPSVQGHPESRSVKQYFSTHLWGWFPRGLVFEPVDSIKYAFCPLCELVWLDMDPCLIAVGFSGLGALRHDTSTTTPAILILRPTSPDS